MVLLETPGSFVTFSCALPSWEGGPSSGQEEESQANVLV